MMANELGLTVDAVTEKIAKLSEVNPMVSPHAREHAVGPFAKEHVVLARSFLVLFVKSVHIFKVFWKECRKALCRFAHRAFGGREASGVSSRLCVDLIC